MYRLTSAAVSLALALALALALGCASVPDTTSTAASASNTSDTTAATPSASVGASSAAHVLSVAADVPVEKNAPAAPGHPLTSVVVTQCNLIVTVYLTMPDGRLLRFDKSADIPAAQLLSMAYTATRSERVEVSCEQTGAVGHEHHGEL